MEDNQRGFKRYEGGSDCEVISGAETYIGKLIDYSDGIRAAFENAPNLVPGKKVDIKVFDPKMEFKGEVAWVDRSGSEVVAGFRRLDILQGSLKSFALADILIGLQRSTKTGILKVKSGSILKDVYINNGDMIFASSNSSEDRLCEILLKEGKINKTIFNMANILINKRKDKPGKILVELGALTPKEVFASVCHQMEEIILSLFAFEDGKFMFIEGPLPEGELITFRISAANIIYRGIKRVTNMLQIKIAVPNPEEVLDISPSPMNIFQDLVLDASGKLVLSMINGIRPLQTIMSITPLNNADILKSICAFLSIGLIIVKQEDKEPTRLKVEEIIYEPSEDMTKEYIDKIDDMNRRCETYGYYELLGLKEDSSTKEISDAYLRTSKEFHPDRHFSITSGDYKEKLTRVFSYVTEAYEVLSDPKRRAEYDMTLAPEIKEPVETIEEDFTAPEPEEAVLEAIEAEEPADMMTEEITVSGTGDTYVESAETEKPGEIIPEETPALEKGPSPEKPFEDFEEPLTEEILKGVSSENRYMGDLSELEKEVIEPEDAAEASQTALKNTLSNMENGRKKSRIYVAAGACLVLLLLSVYFTAFRDSGKKPAVTSHAPESLQTINTLETGMRSPEEDDISGILPETEPYVTSQRSDKQTLPESAQRQTTPEEKTGIQEEVNSPVEDQPAVMKDTTVVKSSINAGKAADKSAQPIVEKFPAAVSEKVKLVRRVPAKRKSGIAASVPAIIKGSPSSTSPEGVMPFEEHFDDNSNNWEIFNTKAASARIEDGLYYLENKRAKGEVIILHNSDYPLDRNFRIETSIKTISAAGINSYGFVLGASDSGNNYAFQINSEGGYSIKRYKDGVPELISGGKIKEPVVNNSSYNFLLMEKRGGTIRFYVNNYYVDEVGNVSLPGGKIGYIMGGKSVIAAGMARSQI